MTYDSLAESTAASVITALGGRRCNSFALHFSESYRDADGVTLEGKPDFVVQRQHGPVFIELKDGALNNHYTRDSSHAALADEYIRILHRPANGLSHAELSRALYEAPSRAGAVAALQAFNHSLWKVLALQAQLGWRHYIVCFKDNPKPSDAERYSAAGLVWCTLKTLPQLLIRIELDSLGIGSSFVHRAQKFSYKVEFDNGTATLDEVRADFIATVEANKAAIAAQREKEAADLAAGLLPF